MMNNMFLGKPPEKIITWIKKHPVPPYPEFDGDIYVLDDGTEVKVSKDDPLAQGDINIHNLPNGLSNDKIALYKYGVGHEGGAYDIIIRLNYNDRPHGLDLSKAKIHEIKAERTIRRFEFEDNKLTSFLLPDSLIYFDDIECGINQLSSFSLPNSLTSFGTCDVSENQLTSFLLPDSLKNFGVMCIDSNQLLTSISLPASLTQFSYLVLDDTCNIDCTQCISPPTNRGIYNDIMYSVLWQGTVLVKDETQKEAFKADAVWCKYKIQVK